MHFHKIALDFIYIKMSPFKIIRSPFESFLSKEIIGTIVIKLFDDFLEWQLIDWTL